MDPFVFGGIVAILAGLLTLTLKLTTDYQIFEPMMPIAAMVGGGLALLIRPRAG